MVMDSLWLLFKRVLTEWSDLFHVKNTLQLCFTGMNHALF